MRLQLIALSAALIAGAAAAQEPPAPQPTPTPDYNPGSFAVARAQASRAVHAQTRGVFDRDYREMLQREEHRSYEAHGLRVAERIGPMVEAGRCAEAAGIAREANFPGMATKVEYICVEGQGIHPARIGG